MFKNILAIGAHADDVELGCSGTLLKYKEQGANIDIVHENGDTALMWASYYGQKKSVKHLINNGANVNATDVNGKSVLMWAVSKANNKKIVKLLIDYGADIYATDVNGKPVWAVWAENNSLNSL